MLARRHKIGQVNAFFKAALRLASLKLTRVKLEGGRELFSSCGILGADETRENIGKKELSESK